MSGKEVEAAENPLRPVGTEIERLADELYRERVRAAREMRPEEKLLAGEELFDYACSITLGGIRNQFPDASDEDCLRILEERLRLRERMEGRE